MSKQDLLHRTEATRAGLRRALWAAAGIVAIAAPPAGCTHTLVFSDTAPIVVTGNPPAPPPKPVELPAPPAAPPAPKLVEVQKDQIVIHEKIQFETDKAAIKPESGPLLEEIKRVIQDNPQLTRLSIEGHTDSTGGDKHNQGLSEQRAASVRDYLVQHGVAADRLGSRGWGKTRPIGDNSTATGRESNRRVEFVIVEQTPPATSTGGAAGAPAAVAPAATAAPTKGAP